MNNLMEIFLKATIGNDSVSGIQKQIEDIQKKAKPMKIDIDTSGATLNMSQISRAIDDASKLEKDWGKAIKMRANEHHSAALKMNGDMESEKKTTQALKEQIELFKRRQEIQARNIETKYKDTYDTEALAKFRAELQTLDATNPKVQSQMKSMAVGLREIGTEARNSGVGVQTLGQNLMGMAKQVAMVAGVSLSIAGVARAIKTGVESVTSLDTSLTELSKVSDLTGRQLETFTDRAYLAGKTIGRTGKEVIDATTSFKRAGYELEESFELSKQALLLTNIGDGINNVEEASSSLIAILKGFKMEAEETAHVVDALNQVSNNFAIDTVNLTEIMKRVSGTVAQTGTTYEQLLGLSTGGFETLRNAEMVASGINMITMRLKGMEESGKSVEGLVPKIQDAFNKYTGGAVSIIDKQNGGLNSTYDILQQLSKVYPTLSDEAKAYLNEAVAGSRQNKVLVSIMENWQNVEAATSSATDSLNSANIENEKYLNSIEGKTAKLSSSMESFWKNLINSDMIKGVIDLLNSLVQVMDSLVNNSFFTFALQVGAISTIIMALGNGLGVLKAAFVATEIGAALLSGTMGALTTAMLASPLFWVVAGTAAIFGIIKAVDSLTVSLEEQREIVQTLSTDIQSLQSEYDKLNADENRNADQDAYLSLLKQEIDDKKELQKIETQRLIDQELFAEGMKRTGRNTSTQEDSGADKIKKSLEELIKLQSELANAPSKKAYDDINEKIINIRLSLTDSLKTISGYVDTMGKDAPKALTDLKLAIESVIIKEDGLTESIEGANEAEEVHQQTLEDLTKSYEDVTSKIQTYNVFLSELNSKEGLSAQAKQDIIMKHQELLPYINDEMALRNHLMQIIQEEERVQKQAYVNMIMASEEYFNAKIRGTSFLYDQLGQFYTKDLENAKSLAEAKAMVENRLIDELTKAWGSYFNVQAAAFAGMQGAQDMALADMSQSDWNGMGKSQQDAFNKSYFKGVASQKAATAFSGIKLSLGNVGFKDINMGNVKTGGGSGSKSGGGSGGSGSKTGGATKEEYKATADAYQKINLELDRNNVLLQLNKAYQDQAGDDIAKKIKLIEKEALIYKDKQGLLHQYNEQLRGEAKQLQSELSSIFRFEGRWDDNSMKIVDEDMGKVAGKSKDIEEKFNRIIAIMKELPKGSQEWLNLKKAIEDTGVSINELQKQQLSDRLANSKNWIEKRNFYDDWGADNEISAWERVRDYISDYYQKGIISHKEYADYIMDIDRNVAAENKRILDEREKLVQEHIKKLNDAYSEQQDQLSKLESIQEKLVAIIRKRGEEEKKQLDEVHKAEMDSLDERHNERKKKWAEETDLFKKMIQDRIDAMDEQNNEEDYLEELQKERDKANELQKQIDVLSLDDSLTARNKVVELRKQLADQNDVIAKKQQKKERDVLKKSLQDQIKDHEKDAKDKEVIADRTYENEKKRLEEDYKINKEFLDKKYSDDKVYAEAKEAILRGQVEVTKGVFMDIYDALVDFENDFGKGMGALGDIIRDELNDNLREAQRLLKETANLSQNLLSRPDSNRDYSDEEIGWSDPRPNTSNNSSSSSNRDPNYGVGNATGQEGKDNEKKLREDAKYRASEIKRTEEVIRDRLSAGMSVKDQEAYLKRLISGSYDNGGKITKTGLTLNSFHGTESNPEWIFNDSQLKNIIKDVTISAMKVTMPKLPNMGSGSGSAFQIDNLINIEGNVTKDTIPLIKQAGNDIAETLKNLNKGGIFRPVKM